MTEDNKTIEETHPAENHHENHIDEEDVGLEHHDDGIF